jgi:hypothetical protein
MESPLLADLADEMAPFTSEYLVDVVTVLDESDVRKMGQYSEETLSERYFKNLDHLRAAEPKRDHGYSAKVNPFEKSKPTKAEA